MVGRGCRRGHNIGGENTKAAQNEQSQAEITTKVAKALREALPMLMAKLHGSGVGPTAEYKSTGTGNNGGVITLVNDVDANKNNKGCHNKAFKDFIPPSFDFKNDAGCTREWVEEMSPNTIFRKCWRDASSRGGTISSLTSRASESTIRAHAKRCKIKLGSKDSTSDSLSVVDKVHEGPRVEEGKKEMKRKACDMLRSLRIKVAELFDLEKGAFTIKYVDDDGDLCILKKNVHMIACKQGFKRRDTVRLQVEKKDLKILGVEKEG
ncbi:hypothetical protein E3N88_16040 [Mikania micrantha]|uniref:PB1 domain-containing protein n=1 Tax=Mikania micrantha TaxID=192012 RepID=A0A5N6NX52_9ASTR|nr:hypothetical protein E3N88_16040 [Mikania micrantha]